MSSEALTVGTAMLKRRMLARLIDAIWLVPAGWLLWRALTFNTDLGPWWRAAAAGILVSLLQVLIEPLLLSAFGATPGKAFLRLRVLNRDTGGNLSYLSALERTLKVVALALGFWFVPAMPVLWVWAMLSRRRDARAFAWDRGAHGANVLLEPTPRIGRACALLVGAALPGVVAPTALAFLALLGVLVGGLDVAQDIGRAVTGRWYWLHRLSGASIEMDTRWRVSNDYLFVGSRRAGAEFTFGTGKDNQVRLEIEWKLGAPDPCAMNALDMADEGFIFLHEGTYAVGGSGSCRVSGGRAGANGIVHVTIEAIRTKGVSYVVIRTWEENDAKKREAVHALSEHLKNEAGRVDAVAGVLRSYRWRNDITGREVKLPGDWEYSSRWIREDGSIGFEFARLDLSEERPRPVEFAGVFGAPFFVYGDNDPQTRVERTVSARMKDAVISRRARGRHELISDLAGEGRLTHIWTRTGGPMTWGAIWTSPTDGAAIGHPDEHELLARFLETIN